LWDRVLERTNRQRALEQVRQNKGAPGIDGMTVDELPEYLRYHCPEIRAQLAAGTYDPKPVRGVEIPKPDGRMRPLGIPTVLGRFIQQALAQGVSAQWEPHFHPRGFGFRPQRSAHQAVRCLQADIREGRRWVVDIDLEAFFDRVNHDRLMNRLKLHVPDTALLRLINRYLKAGVRVGDRTEETTMGVPPGGPVSPVLANVVLDELDWELERRGHRFARYADDCNIVVRSRRAGERVMASVTRFVEDSLRLTVNTRKSAVDRPWNRKFLGFTVSRNHIELKVADTAIEKLKMEVRCMPAHSALGPGWPSPLRPINPPKPATMRVISPKVGGVLGGLSRCATIQAACHSSGAHTTSQESSGHSRPRVTRAKRRQATMR
jgi:group II intron reverse transcriptase/maturase